MFLLKSAHRAKLESLSWFGSALFLTIYFRSQCIDSSLHALILISQLMQAYLEENHAKLLNKERSLMSQMSDLQKLVIGYCWGH